MQKRKRDDKEYEIEGIINKRVDSGQVQYKVKWKGYSEEKATWEPEENLTKAKKLLREYDEINQSTIHNFFKTPTDSTIIKEIEPRTSQKKSSSKVASRTNVSSKIKVAPETKVFSETINSSETNELVFRVPRLKKKFEFNPKIIIHVDEDSDDSVDDPKITKVVKMKRIEDEVFVYTKTENSKKKVVKKSSMTLTEFKKRHSSILVDYLMKELCDKEDEKEKNEAKKTKNESEKDEDIAMSLDTEKKDVKSNNNDNKSS